MQNGQGRMKFLKVEVETVVEVFPGWDDVVAGWQLTKGQQKCRISAANAQFVVLLNRAHSVQVELVNNALWRSSHIGRLGHFIGFLTRPPFERRRSTERIHRSRP
jgi:hypothetical protein